MVVCLKKQKQTNMYMISRFAAFILSHELHMSETYFYSRNKQLLIFKKSTWEISSLTEKPGNFKLLLQ